MTIKSLNALSTTSLSANLIRLLQNNLNCNCGVAVNAHFYTPCATAGTGDRRLCHLSEDLSNNIVLKEHNDNYPTHRKYSALYHVLINELVNHNLIYNAAPKVTIPLSNTTQLINIINSIISNFNAGIYRMGTNGYYY